MLTRRTAIALLGLIAAPALAQQTVPPPAPAPSPTPVPTPSSNLPRVAITTTAGKFIVEADTVRAPITAGNFLKYVDQKRLDGVSFYRVVKPAERFGFVQFGPQGDPKRILPNIKHEPTSLTGIKHTDGTLSIARLAPGSANGEFTIMIGDQPSMDADPTKPDDTTKSNLGYAAWGHVVEGMDVVVKILDTPVSATRTSRGAFKGEMPDAPVTIVTARRVRP
jgi:peptidyl-prolyl cis-trans isomerase A (cyclophilin A)